MTMKIYTKGEQVNIIRGGLKGISGFVDEMNDETGEVTITNGDGIYVKVSNGCLARPSKPQDLMPILEKKTEPEEEIEEKVAETKVELPSDQINTPKVPRKVAERRLCECKCGMLASPRRFFVMGHDQRHKGNLIRAMQAGDEEAEAELRKRNWRTDAEIMALKRKAREAAERKEAREKAANKP